MRSVLESLAEKLQVAVDFTGAVRPDDVAPLLTACDAACAPYPVPEADHDDYFSPLKIFEYMAAAMPIIATATGQIPSILVDGQTGLLVPAGDRRAFADGLAALAADPALRLRLGQAARAEAVKRFSWERVLSTITAALPKTGKVVTP
jgi:glycosyltransferase involved in cell wall biosynthesis